MLFDEDARGERLRRVVVCDGHNALRDDGAAVQSLIDEVDGAAAEFDAVLDGLSLRVEAGEGGQQTRMNIKYASAISCDEDGREQAHVTGEADEFDVMRLQRCNDLAFMFGACAPATFDGERFDPTFGGAGKSRRFCVIAQDERDLGSGYFAAPDRSGERQHVRAATGDEDG
jgi:hypothetical protein